MFLFLALNRCTSLFLFCEFCHQAPERSYSFCFDVAFDDCRFRHRWYLWFSWFQFCVLRHLNVFHFRAPKCHDAFLIWWIYAVCVSCVALFSVICSFDTAACCDALCLEQVFGVLECLVVHHESIIKLINQWFDVSFINIQNIVP